MAHLNIVDLEHNQWYGTSHSQPGTRHPLAFNGHTIVQMKKIILILPLLSACATTYSEDEPSLYEDETSETGVSLQELVTDKLPGIYQYYYRISDTTGKSVSIPSGNRYTYLENYVGDNNQKFLIMPVSPEDNRFYIVPKHRGGVLDVESGCVYMYDDYPYHENYLQIFTLNRNLGGDFFELISLTTGETIGVINKGLKKCLGFTGAPNGSTIQRIRFSPQEALPYSAPAAESGAAPGAIGDVPRITSYRDTPPMTSTPVLIGKSVIPFVYIRNDGSRTYQAQYTPYYTLTREQYWKRAEFREKPAAASSRQTYSFTTSMSREESISIEQKTGIIIKANGTLEFAKSILKATLGVNLERQLSVVTTHKTSRTYSESVTETFETFFPEGRRVRWAAWHLVDRYTLRRMDDTSADSWELVYRDNRIADAYYE